MVGSEQLALNLGGYRGRLLGSQRLCSDSDNVLQTVGREVLVRVIIRGVKYNETSGTSRIRDATVSDIRGTCLRRTPLTPTNDIQLQWQIKRS